MQGKRHWPESACCNYPQLLAGAARLHRQLRRTVHRAHGDLVDRVIRDGAASDARQHVQQRSVSRLRRHIHLPRHQSR